MIIIGLRCTIDWSWYYRKFPSVLEGYSDANWELDKDEINSTSGYVSTLCGGAISGKSAK